MNEQEEEFLHLANSIENLNSSWRILKEIVEVKSSPVLLNAAFQYALIEYSKPYRYSCGEVLNEKGKPKRYKLDAQFIPPDSLDLHKRITDARDQLHAHSDLTLLEAKVYVCDSEYGKSVNYSRNIIHGTEELKNINSILDLIEGTLDALYERERQLKLKLPVNSA